MLTLKCKNCGVDFSRPEWKNYQKYCSLKCRIPWNKGIPITEEARQKIKLARAKQIMPKGENNKNWIKIMPTKICELCKKEFTKKRTTAQILWKKQRFCSMKCTATYASSFAPKGKLHGQWRGGVSKLAMKIRKMKKYLELRLSIY